MSARIHRVRARRSERGQNMTEVALLTSVLLIGIGGLMVFAPDALQAFTIYIQGFYLILGLPLG